MGLTKNMNDKEIIKISKRKPIFEKKYKNGVYLTNKTQVIDMINQPESHIEIIKQSDLGDGVEALTIRIICNSING